MLKAYKYRLYPSKQQEEQIQKTFGCCRFVHNRTLSYRKEMYETKKESMNKFACNNKVISDCDWYELTRQLTYKADWNNRQYIKIGRFVPSSQTCSCCGFINVETKDLSVREWTCPKCGVHHDRDINAAKNILNEGLRLLEKTA